MRTHRILSVAVVLAVAALAAEVAWTQVPNVPVPGPVNPPTAALPSDGGGGAWLTVLVLVGFLVVIGVAGKLLDLRRKRQAEAVHVQAQVSDALLRDPTLFGLPVTPTAHVPGWRGSPVILENTGEVPTAELREAVLRIARSEASRIRPDVQVVDRLVVTPIAARRLTTAGRIRHGECIDQGWVSRSAPRRSRCAAPSASP